MNKKFIIFLLSLLFLIHSQAAYALMPMYKPPPPQINMQDFLGEDQNYSVVLRGNGEAVVLFKSIIFNSGDNYLSQVNVHFPYTIQPQDIRVFQVLTKGNCLQYRPQPLQLQTQPELPTPTPFNYQQQENKIIPPAVIPNGDLYPLPPQQQICESYSQPDFQNLSENTKYLKASYDYSGNTVHITLPQPVQPNQNGSYLFYYRTFAYVEKTLFGAYDFEFQTPKFENTINSLQIGITTDSDLILHGDKGRVNYDNGKVSLSVPAFGNSSSDSIQNPRFNDFYNQIGQGDITKNASNLQPLETYKVQGTYADSQLKLYGRNIAVTICIIILLSLIVFLAIKYIIYKLTRNKKTIQVASVPTMQAKHLKLFLVLGGISLGSILLISLYSVVSVFLYTLVKDTEFSFIFLMLLFLISIAVYGFLLCVPSIGVAIKKGWIWGVVTFSMTIFWLIVVLVIISISLFLFFPSSNYTYPLKNFLGL